MPELPEVETIRKYLNKTILRKRIVNIKVFSKKQFPNNSEEIVGAKILSVKRRAKNLIIELSNEKTLLIHLKLSGQLLWRPKTLNKTTRIVIVFDKGELVFNDLRKFGWIKILNLDQLDLELKKFGPEPFSKDFSIKYLQKVFKKSIRPVKTILLDQEKIAGIGNIYANEALSEAEISPQKPVKALTIEEIKKLQKAILLVLKEGIKYNGASAADKLYLKPDSSNGSYQQHFRIYQKNGEKCKKCNTIIERINLGGRGTFFCPKCQNMSRFRYI
ncbi:MAG: formamidopyrimidine-DNA glycosylase [Parcubacteria group bacterium CG23_combo_of_CG06-09_8_20_14_all_35_6]|nr:MAG: formamidopyrimidine-DNA glycosylase [Parcubacteria group bacterium CG23_combo_of_CG06-09_8_20_14_all_35_6]